MDGEWATPHAEEPLEHWVRKRINSCLGMDGISYADLISQVRYLRASYPGPVTETLLTHGLADYVLSRLLGREWVNQAVYPQHEEISDQNRPDRDFLKTEDSLGDTQFIHRLRVRNLAEHLYNLQDVEGFERVVHGIESDRLEAYYSEVEFPGHLKRAGIGFRFNPESGEKGEDYDIEIFAPGGEVAFEIATKIEGTDPSVDKLFDIYSSKLGSLPGGRPGLIGIKLPVDWTGAGVIGEVVQGMEDMVEFSGIGGNVLGIIFRWHVFRSVTVNASGTRKSMLFPVFRVEVNKKSGFLRPSYLQVLRSLREVPSGEDVEGWTNLRQVALLA